MTGKNDTSEKVLGLFWNCTTDEFQFLFQVVCIQMLFQALCLDKVEWDSELKGKYLKQ